MRNEEKTPPDTNKRVKLFGNGNTVQREDFDGTSKAFNTLQVKFDCREGNEGGTIFGMYTSNDRVTENKA